VPRRAQRGDGGVTTHEADQQPFDPGGRPSSARDDLIDSRRDEAGAARDDQMSDRLGREGVAQRRDSFHRQHGRRFGVQRHARRCGRQWIGCVEAAGLDRRSAAWRTREHRPAMRDARPRGHARKDCADALVGQSRRCPVDKRCMDFVPRHRGGEGVQPGGRRGIGHRAHVAEKQGTGQRLAPRQLYCGLTTVG
jgi:hypothetical protein